MKLRTESNRYLLRRIARIYNQGRVIKVQISDKVVEMKARYTLR